MSEAQALGMCFAMLGVFLANFARDNLTGRVGIGLMFLSILVWNF